MDKSHNPVIDDMMIEAAVLRHLLALHPIQLSLDELVLEIAGEAADFMQTDAVKRAVTQLNGTGLAHRNGNVIRPSRAALRMDELFE